MAIRISLASLQVNEPFMPREQLPVTKEVITWARVRAGYSLEQAKRHFSKIEEWENGVSFPTYPQIERLSEKFKIPVAVFFFPQPPELPSISETFRTLGSEQFELIPPRVRLLLRKARAFQISVSELNGGQNPAKQLITRDLAFRSTISIDLMARRIREYLGISLNEQVSWQNEQVALENWRQCLLSAGIYVFKDQFRFDEFSGFCLYDEQFPIIYVNNSTSKTRQIFTLFHELAHLVFHTSGIDTLHDDFIDSLPSTKKRIEVICNRFAGRFLVPEHAFEDALSDREISEESAESLASYFKVSRELIFRKFLDRRLITKKAYEVAAKKWAKQKRPGGGGDHYNTKISYLGLDYIRLAFSQFYRNRIDEYQLAEYLNTKPKNLNTLEEYVSRRVP